MQNVMQIATNAGHTAQNDGRTMQNDGQPHLMLAATTNKYYGGDISVSYY